MGLAWAEPLSEAEKTLKLPLTRTQAQKLSKLKGTEFDQELRRIDRRGHTILVGELNQQAVDAFCEWFLFAIALLDGQKPAESPPGASFAAHLQQILMRGWPKLSTANRKKLTDFPEYWAAVRRDWPSLSGERRQEMLGNWGTALAPLLHSSERQELARACLADLQSSYRSQTDPDQLERALQRVESAARRMAAEGDPESTALARQLRQAVLSIQAKQDQARALQEIEAQKGRLSAPGAGDYNRVLDQINQGNLKRYHIQR